jgi:hypothetical protein
MSESMESANPVIDATETPKDVPVTTNSSTLGDSLVAHDSITLESTPANMADPVEVDSSTSDDLASPAVPTLADSSSTGSDPIIAAAGASGSATPTITDTAIGSDGAHVSISGGTESHQKDYLPNYWADSIGRDDLLGIGYDLRAFAKLIAAKEITPPLSIGLFGEWGSGKSFFMDALYWKIEDISKGVRNASPSSGPIQFHGRIVQIRFNAWQYMESNLWASLVEHVLKGLIEPDPHAKGALDEKRDALLVQVLAAEQDKEAADKQVKDLETQRDEAKDSVSQANKAYMEAQQEAERAGGILRAAIVDPDNRKMVEEALKPFGLSALVAATDDLGEALGEATSTVQRGNLLLNAVVRNPSGWGYMVGLALVLVASLLLSLVAAWLAHHQGDAWFAQITGIFTAVTAFIGLAAEWIRRQAKWVSARFDNVEQAKKRYEKTITDKKAELLAAQEREERAREYVERARQAAAEAEQRVERSKAALEEATPERLVAQYIQDRVDSADYSKHLGLLARIRADFDVISTALTKKDTNDAATSQTKGIDRIVLYIDDLDRCPPQKVVEVLQAVHLLLAYPLFVVIVAVDVRWVYRSLALTYKDLLLDRQAQNGAVNTIRTLDSASPLDYLEKVFQIPYWLGPTSPKSRKNMLRGLLTGTDGRLGATSSTGGPKAHPAAQPPTASPSQQDVPPPPDLLGVQADIDLYAPTLAIHPDEVDFAQKLEPLLGRTPRALKRFANTYQLIKASLGPNDADLVLDTQPTTGEYRLVMLIVALFTYSPSIARAIGSAVDTLVRQQAQSQADAGATPAPTDVRTGVVAGETANSVWTMLLEQVDKDTVVGSSSDWIQVKDWLGQDEQHEHLETDLSRLAFWVGRIARFSFRVETA